MPFPFNWKRKIWIHVLTCVQTRPRTPSSPLDVAFFALQPIIVRWCLPSCRLHGAYLLVLKLPRQRTIKLFSVVISFSLFLRDHKNQWSHNTERYAPRFSQVTKQPWHDFLISHTCYGYRVFVLAILRRCQCTPPFLNCLLAPATPCCCSKSGVMHNQCAFLNATFFLLLLCLLCSWPAWDRYCSWWGSTRAGGGGLCVCVCVRVIWFVQRRRSWFSAPPLFCWTKDRWALAAKRLLSLTKLVGGARPLDQAQQSAQTRGRVLGGTA